MLKGTIGLLLLLLGTAALAVGQSAVAQTPVYELYEGVTVEPGSVTSPDTVFNVSGPIFPNDFGCRTGNINAVPEGGTVSNAVLLEGAENLNDADNEAGTRWIVPIRAGAVPLGVGRYTIYLDCQEASLQEIYRTEGVFTVAATATTIPTTTTLPPPSSTTTLPSVDGSVDPTTAVPGETTITIRGGGFKPGATLQIALGSKPPTALGTTTADDAGFYWTTLKLPRNAPPGNQQVVVTGPAPDDSTRTTTAGLIVADLDCTDFASNDAAQAAMGSGGSDPHRLDGNRDGVACNGVSARTATGSGATAAPVAGGTLAATGSERAEVGVMVGLAALTLGALLVGLSHPAVPAAGDHRRRRRYR